MYVLLIYNDQACEKLNCIWLYDSVKELMANTKNIIKYNDINRKTRVYKTAKSFFRVLKISSTDKKKYFK